MSLASLALISAAYRKISTATSDGSAQAYREAKAPPQREKRFPEPKRPAGTAVKRTITPKITNPQPGHSNTKGAP